MAKKSAAKSKRFTKTEEDDAPRGPRALWKGTIAFGLVSIPVRMVTAIRDTGIHFHRVTPDGKCRLRQRLYCPDTGKEYDFKESARGYEIAPNQYVIVDPEELEAVQPHAGHEIEISQFVKLEEIDPLYYDRPYFFLPDGSGAKAYELLRKVLESTDKAALGKMIMHDKQYIALIRSVSGVLCIQTLHFADEVVKAGALAEQADVKINKGEMDLAEELIKSLTKPFQAEKFVDDSKEQMKKLLDKKSKGKVIKIEPPEEIESGGKVVDLMGRLKASLREQSKRKPEKKRAGGRS